MRSALKQVAGYWDEHIATWLAGKDPMGDPMPEWFASYQGRGTGEVTRDGFPEPYSGDLLGLVGTPRLVVLGLNPGRYYPRFQSREGIFANEIRQHGCYSNWMTTGPYFRAPWTAIIGPNRYFLARQSFTQRWLSDPTATYNDLLIFEAYPWHSTIINAALHPPANVIDNFVQQPIAELPVQDIFAFGRPWERLVKNLGLPLTDALGAGGHDYGSPVRDRAIRVYMLPSGQRLIVEWHKGSAGPPSEPEVARLKAALG